MKKIILTLFVFIYTSTMAESINNVTLKYHKNYDYYTMKISGKINVPMQVFLDIDGDENTGYSEGTVRGAERLIEIYDFNSKNNQVYSYSGNGSSWNWDEAYQIPKDELWKGNNSIYLDLSRWSFGTNQDLDNKHFKYRVIIWNHSWTNIIASYPTNGKMKTYENNNNSNNNSLAPYSSNKFKDVLKLTKLQYPESATAVNYGQFKEFSSDYFYLSDGYMVFDIDQSKFDGYIKRVELRHGPADYSTWKVSTHNTKSISAIVNLPGSNDTPLNEYTWLQIHDKGKYNKPLIRLVWRSNRAGHNDYLWAALKTDNLGKHTQWIPLMSRTDSDVSAEIIVDNNQLTVKLNGKSIDRLDKRDISYWNDNHHNYFKAGVYISSTSNERSANWDIDKKNRNVQVKFKALKFK